MKNVLRLVLVVLVPLFVFSTLCFAGDATAQSSAAPKTTCSVAKNTAVKTGQKSQNIQPRKKTEEKAKPVKAAAPKTAVKKAAKATPEVKKSAPKQNFTTLNKAEEVKPVVKEEPKK
jgi:hypothetical protein